MWDVEWIVEPAEGRIGPLQLGMSRAQIHSLLGEPQFEQRWPDGSVTEYFHRNEIQVTFASGQEVCSFIEVTGDIPAVLFGFPVLKRPLDHVRADLAKLGYELDVNDPATFVIRGMAAGFYVEFEEDEVDIIMCVSVGDV